MASRAGVSTELRWTVKLGTIGGAAIYVHATFLLLVAWLALLSWRQTHTIGGVLDSITFIVAVFGCIVVHELGHGLAARIFGIGTRDITLLPIGGISRLERMPEAPWQEFWVAVAGPMTSIAVGAALFGIVLAAGRPSATSDVALVELPFLERLAFVNLALAAFNLLPAFPMDGGRVLRAALAMRVDRVRATDIAGAIGQSLAFLLLGAGLFSSPLLVLVAIFIWLGAAEERRVEQIKAALKDVHVSAAMRTEVSSLAPEDTLEHAAALAVRSGQRDFPVLDHLTLVGMLSSEQLRRALSAAGPSGTVGNAMQRQFDAAQADEPLDRVFAGLDARAGGAVAVTSPDGRLVGLLSRQSLEAFLEWRRARASTAA